MVARGEVWWYESPEAGRRPYLVLTRSEAIPVLRQVLAAPATRTIRGIPTEVGLDRSDGLPEPCVLALDNVSTNPGGTLHRADRPSRSGPNGSGVRGPPPRNRVLSCPPSS